MKKSLLLLALSAMVIGGCSKSEIDEGSINSTNAISFSTSSNKLTKAPALSNENATEFDFGVFAYYTGQEDWATAGATDPNFMNNQMVEYVGSAWTYTPMKYWPNKDGDKISFFGYMPMNDGTDTEVATTDATTTDATLPAIKFTQVMDAEYMTDFTVGKVLNQTRTSQSVAIPFNHVLTRLNFSAKSLEALDSGTAIYVTGLKVVQSESSRLFSEATYSMSNVADVNGTWSTENEEGVAATGDIDLASILDLTTTHTVVTSATVNAVEVTGTDNTALLTTGQYLFLIPPYGKDGVKSDGDIRVEISYDVITYDAGITVNDGLATSSATETLSLPTGSLVEGLAYNVVMTIGLDGVKLSADPTDWVVETEIDGVATEVTVQNVADIATTIAEAFENDVTTFAVNYEGDEDGLEITIPDAAENPDMNIIINLPEQNYGVTIDIPTNYTGSITIYAPNATVTTKASDAQYSNLTVTTKPGTFIIAAGTTVTDLTINGGNVEVYGTLEGVIRAAAGITTTIRPMDDGDISGITSYDENVTIYSDPITFEPVANCYMIDIDNIPDELYISLDMAREGWQLVDETTGGSNYDGTFCYELANGDLQVETCWRTWGSGDASCNITGTPIWGGKWGDELGLKLDFTAVKSAITQGENAVIYLLSKGGNGDIGDDLPLWNWHIWFTDYKPSISDISAENGQVHEYGGDIFDAGGTYEGKGMMDRNLGATITDVSGDIKPTSDYEKYYGLYYQFGRKDPFVGYAGDYTESNDRMPIYGADGIAADITLQAYTFSPYNLTISFYNPLRYFTGTSVWVRAYTNCDYWRQTGEKSPFDPSPAGWRVPVSEAFADFDDQGEGSSNIKYKGKVYPTVNAYFPSSGFINYDGVLKTCTVSNPQTYMYTASSTSAKGDFMEYYTGSSDNIKIGTCYFTTIGTPIRCVQDPTYVAE